MIRRALDARRALLTIAPAAVVLALVWPLARPVPGQGDTFQFWFAGHLIATGRSPYDLAAWGDAARFGPIAANVAGNCADGAHPVCVWLYPPHTAWLFAPLGALPTALGVALVDALVLISLVAGAIACVVEFGPRSSAARAVILASVVAAHPFAVDIRHGHFVGLLLLGLALVARGIADGRVGPLVGGAVLLTLKAHLFLLFAPVVAVWLAYRRRWRALAWTAAAVAGLAVLGLAIHPEALGAILGRASEKSGIAWSSTAALAAGVPGGALVAVLLASAIGATAWRTAASDPRLVLAVAAAVSLVAAPYAQPYDLLLLVPLLAVAARRAESIGPRTAGSVVAAIVLLFALGSWLSVVGAAAGSRLLHPGALPLAALALAVAISWRAPARRASEAGM